MIYDIKTYAGIRTIFKPAPSHSQSQFRYRYHFYIYSIYIEKLKNSNNERGKLVQLLMTNAHDLWRTILKSKSIFCRQKKQSLQSR